jgi:hypothetical protein
VVNIKKVHVTFIGLSFCLLCNDLNAKTARDGVFSLLQIIIFEDHHKGNLNTMQPQHQQQLTMDDS